MLQPCPCRDCERRKFLCHSNCKEYQDWKTGYETVRDGLAEERAVYSEPARRIMLKIWRRMKK
jgi:hypothetical protein